MAAGTERTLLAVHPRLPGKASDTRRIVAAAGDSAAVNGAGGDSHVRFWPEAGIENSANDQTSAAAQSFTCSAT